MKSFSFPPVENKNAKILILGTMPGKTSLEKGEYYAYKYNVFWKILFGLFKENISKDYETKKKMLTNNNIALWDVLKYCYRKGSADADIKDEIPNDFAIFYKSHPHIKHVFFNGTAAMKYYKRHVGFSEKLSYKVLPSTSPANARMSFEEKLKKWFVIIDALKDEK